MQFRLGRLKPLGTWIAWDRGRNYCWLRVVDVERAARGDQFDETGRTIVVANVERERQADFARIGLADGKYVFMVFQVLEQVAYGTPWERIVWSWRGKAPMEAIFITFGGQTFVTKETTMWLNWPSRATRE